MVNTIYSLTVISTETCSDIAGITVKAVRWQKVLTTILTFGGNKTAKGFITIIRDKN